VKKYRSRLLLGVIAGVVAIALMLILAANESTTPTPASTHKSETWNGENTVGIRSKGGHVAATFGRPADKLLTSPLDSALEVIGEPVDIIPARQTKGLSVIFTVPNRVPLEAKDGNGRLQRSAHNAAIEIYEPSMGAWVPLDTRVEGKILVADAPHFSIFRAVWLKMGEQQVGEIKVTTTPAMTPSEMLWRTGLEYLKQFAFNATGKFDESKFNCSNLNEDYGVTLEKPGRTAGHRPCHDDPQQGRRCHDEWRVCVRP
jgi:hypothetical protein